MSQSHFRPLRIQRSQMNSGKFTFVVDSSPQQPGNIYLSLIMVQGELQPEIAELTLSRYRSRPAVWKASNPSPVPLAWAQIPAFTQQPQSIQPVPLKSGLFYLITAMGKDAFLTNAWLNLFFHRLKAGHSLTHVCPGWSTQWAVGLQP